MRHVDASLAPGHLVMTRWRPRLSRNFISNHVTWRHMLKWMLGSTKSHLRQVIKLRRKSGLFLRQFPSWENIEECDLRLPHCLLVIFSRIRTLLTLWGVLGCHKEAKYCHAVESWNCLVWLRLYIPKFVMNYLKTRGFQPCPAFMILWFGLSTLGRNGALASAPAVHSSFFLPITDGSQVLSTSYTFWDNKNLKGLNLHI